VADPKEQLKLYNLILKDDLSVRRVEELARQIANPELTETPKPAKVEPDYGRYDGFARSLNDFSPTAVKFARSANGKGSITFKFASDEELQSLVDMFEKMKQS
ncbi:MAG: hypothetical protein K2H74_01905, partial [Paramuribaculum sp.]|nr:hypothetical protein [Paramuribaculum sp.]